VQRVKLILLHRKHKHNMQDSNEFNLDSERQKDSPLIVSLIINRNELAETGVTQAHGARTGGGTSWQRPKNYTL
jgi:hypothetical protein